MKSVKGSLPSSGQQGAPRCPPSGVDPFTDFAPLEDTYEMMMMMMMMMMAMVIRQVSSGGVKSVKGSQPSSGPQGAPRRSPSGVDPFTDFASLEDTYEMMMMMMMMMIMAMGV